MQNGHSWFETHGTGLVRGSTVNGMLNTQVTQRDDNGWIDRVNIVRQPSLWQETLQELRTYMAER